MKIEMKPLSIEMKINASQNNAADRSINEKEKLD